MRARLTKTSSILRTAFLVAWGAIVVGGVGSYLYYPDAFAAANIAAFILRFHGPLWLIYLVFSTFRGFTLLPSTPLVLAGAIVFPDQPFAVLGVSMMGILLSSTMIYFFSDYLGFNEYFESHKPALMRRVKKNSSTRLAFCLWQYGHFSPLFRPI